MITGPDYGVITYGALGELNYRAESRKIIERQTAEAQVYYGKTANQIESSGKRELANILGEAKKGHYSNIKKNFAPLLDHMVSVYCKKLEAAGQFNSSCLVGIDEARSNVILENLQIMGSGKERLIYSAILFNYARIMSMRFKRHMTLWI